LVEVETQSRLGCVPLLSAVATATAWQALLEPYFQYITGKLFNLQYCIFTLAVTDARLRLGSGLSVSGWMFAGAL